MRSTRNLHSLQKKKKENKQQNTNPAKVKSAKRSETMVTQRNRCDDVSDAFCDYHGKLLLTISGGFMAVNSLFQRFLAVVV